MKKNLGKILITGGSGFIGKNLIEHIYNNYKYEKIISIDNYYSSSKKNNILYKNVHYLKLDTRNINTTKNKLLKNFKPKYVFHFAEFSRIVASFEKIEDCYTFNSNGTFNVLQYCIKNKSKLIYSGSSSKFGHLKNQHLSPYSWTKAKNIELIKNYANWFNLNFSIVYFYNVYGKYQIKNHFMSAVIGIFEEQYLQSKYLTVVKPGYQKRDFTDVRDIVKGTVLAALKGSNDEYHLGTGNNYKMIDVAKMFSNKIKLIPERKGERFSSKSSITKARKALGYKPEFNLEEYIYNFKKDNK